jgi:hypothetical protein
MKKKGLFFLFAGSLLLGTACKSSQGTATNGGEKHTSGNEVCKMADPNIPHISWVKETEDVLKGKDVVVLPKVYNIYSADSAQLRHFFTVAKSSKENSKAEVIIPLPQPVGCKVFSVYQSGTMSEELQKKFPDLVTLKGADKETGLNDIRMEYNGRMMQGQVTVNGEIYLIAPVSNNNHLYYIVYAKSETKEIKRNFEGKQQTDPETLPKPEIIRYDR